MDISTKYRLLTRMPLLQGLSGQDLARLEEAHGLDVERIPPSRVPLLNQGNTCRQLILVASGTLRRTHATSDGRLTLSALMQPPVALEPENLYGLHCHYSDSYYAESELQVISIRKSDVGKYLMNVPIFRLNLLNYLSAVSHKQSLLMAPCPSRPVREKFVHLLETLCHEDDTDITLSIKMTDLALYLGETRLTISHMLNSLATQQAISLARSTISIPSLHTLRTHI